MKRVTALGHVFIDIIVLCNVLIVTIKLFVGTFKVRNCSLNDTHTKRNSSYDNFLFFRIILPIRMNLRIKVRGLVNTIGKLRFSAVSKRCYRLIRDNSS